MNKPAKRWLKISEDYILSDICKDMVSGEPIKALEYLDTLSADKQLETGNTCVIGRIRYGVVRHNGKIEKNRDMYAVYMQDEEGVEQDFDIRIFQYNIKDISKEERKAFRMFSEKQDEKILKEREKKARSRKDLILIDTQSIYKVRLANALVNY